MTEFTNQTIAPNKNSQVLNTSADELVKTQKSVLQIRLLKGPISRQKQADLWAWLARDQYQIRQYFAEIGLSLTLDEAEGYAFLRQTAIEEPASSLAAQHNEHNEKNTEQAGLTLPRLIAKRALPFAQSLLLVLIRKRLAEHDSEESSPRLIITRSEIHQWLQPYFQMDNNEVKQQREFNALINKIAELGFIRVLSNYPDEFEVQRIIKAFINAEHIAQQVSLLTEYAQSKLSEVDTDTNTVTKKQSKRIEL